MTNAQAFHPAARSPALRPLILALALLSAWFGLLPGVVHAPIRNAPLGPLPCCIERPVAPHETCLSRSTRERSNLSDRGDAQRAASEPPRTTPLLPVWLDELPRHRPVALRIAIPAVRDQSLIVPPRQPRGPPALNRA